MKSAFASAFIDTDVSDIVFYFFTCNNLWGRAGITKGRAALRGWTDRFTVVGHPTSSDPMI
jgi:hypothetical protein